MSPSVSDKLLADRYQLLEPIGVGGMAEVHRAWDTVLRRHVAIKVFQPGFDPAAAQRFDNEVRLLAGLTHPALVSVYDADPGATTPFVVLRLIEGRTLRDLMDLGPLPADRVRGLGARLADALAYVHAHDLVHRDVKPSNILLDQDDEPYLADFGLAHLTGATRLTRTNQLVGTAAYLAPEQVLGQDIGTPADVYALGLVLLECLTGQREYQGGDVEAAVARLHRPPVVPDDLPPEVRDLLARMTSSTPEDRPTAHDCAQVLGSAIPLAVDVPRSEAVTEELPRGARPWKALVASAGALIGAFAITLAATSGQPPTGSTPPAGSTQQQQQQQEAAPEQPGSTDPVREQGNPQYMVNQQQGTGSTAVTTTVQPTTSAAAPAADTPAGGTPEPVTGPEDGATTTEPAPTTTVDPPTSEAPTTTVGTPEPEPEDPPSEPIENSAGPSEDAG